MLLTQFVDRVVTLEGLQRYLRLKSGTKDATLPCHGKLLLRKTACNNHRFNAQSKLFYLSPWSDNWGPLQSEPKHYLNSY